MFVQRAKRLIPSIKDSAQRLNLNYFINHIQTFINGYPFKGTLRTVIKCVLIHLHILFLNEQGHNFQTCLKLYSWKGLENARAHQKFMIFKLSLFCICLYVFGNYGFPECNILAKMFFKLFVENKLSPCFVSPVKW
jgi:hypothetical protein